MDKLKNDLTVIVAFTKLEIDHCQRFYFVWMLLLAQPSPVFKDE